MRINRLAFIVVVGAAALGVAACSSSSGGASTTANYCLFNVGGASGSGIVAAPQPQADQGSCNTTLVNIEGGYADAGDGVTFEKAAYLSPSQRSSLPVYGDAAAYLDGEPWLVVSGDPADPSNEAQPSAQAQPQQTQQAEQSQAQAAQAQQQADQQARAQVQEDIGAAQQGDEVSDYTSVLSRFKQDLATGDCGDAITISEGGLANPEISAIDTLLGDLSTGVGNLSTGTSLNGQINAEIAKAESALSQVFSAANSIIAQAYNNCGIGSVGPAYSPSSGSNGD